MGKLIKVVAFFILILFSGFGYGQTQKAINIQNQDALLQKIQSKFSALQVQSIRPAEGYIKYDYLIPAGFYKQMWDWDGFFIGCHLASESKENAKYLKWWVLNFANSADSTGYVPGCITIRGPRPIFGKFAMKPFLSQGAFLASKRMNDFSWITPAVYQELKNVLSYREQTQYDKKYHLFFWDNGGESGADNSVVLTNDKNDPDAIIGVDINTFQYREYVSMSKIAARLGRMSDVSIYKAKASELKNDMMKYLWFSKDHSFFNIRRDKGKAIKRVSYSNFVPLIEGSQFLSEKEGREMIKKYLLNKEYMNAPFGFRSLSKQDVGYNNKAIIDPYSNWQGPIWINANYLYYTALKKYGFIQEANELSTILAKVVLKDIESCGSMHEDYNADTGEPLSPTAAQSENGIFTGFVGWNLLVENMLEESYKGKPLMLDLN